MAEENLEIDIKNGVEQLLKMAKNLCWNKISSNCLFILSEIEEGGGQNFLEIQRIRNHKNNKKTPKRLNDIVLELSKIYDILYDVNLFIYKAESKRTIIEIRYYPKYSLDKDYLLLVKDNPPMWHSKLTLPPYHEKGKSKFDVNWEQGGFRHFWKLFWWKMKKEKSFKTQ